MVAFTPRQSYPYNQVLAISLQGGDCTVLVLLTCRVVRGRRSARSASFDLMTYIAGKAWRCAGLFNSSVETPSVPVPMHFLNSSCDKMEPGIHAHNDRQQPM